MISVAVCMCVVAPGDAVFKPNLNLTKKVILLYKDFLQKKLKEEYGSCVMGTFLAKLAKHVESHTLLTAAMGLFLLPLSLRQ